MTGSHIPSSIRKLLELYKTLSLRLSNLLPQNINSSLSSATDIAIINSQWHLLQNNRTKGERLSRFDDLSSHMFLDPIKFGPYELKKTSQLFDTAQQPPTKSLIPNTNGAGVSKGKYITNVENSIRSYYSPYIRLPKTKKTRDSLKFYKNSLNSNIPITLLLKSTTSLFSSVSMNHFDNTYLGIKTAVDELNSSKGVRYDFSRIQNIDLFKLALEYNNYANTTTKFVSGSVKLPWKDIHQIEDDLVNRITDTHVADLIQTSTGEPIPPNDVNLQRYLAQNVALDLVDPIEIMDYCEQIPYTVRFTNYYSLSLLDLEQDCNDELVELLESADVQIIGARLFLKNKQLNTMINEIIISQDDGIKTSYEDLLKLTHVPDKNDIALLMEYLATKGLVRVKQSADNNALYVLP